MQKAAKIAIALIIIALIAVLGLIAVKNRQDAAPPVEATESPAPSEAPETPEPESEPEEEAAPEDGAQGGEPAGNMYEGALAGKTEEEIGEMAMAEEGVDIGADAGEAAID